MRKRKLVEARKEERLLKFLKLTKTGKYAPIEESSLPYARVKEEREEDVDIYQEDYYYALS